MPCIIRAQHEGEEVILLPPRMYELLELMAEGLSNDAIAKRMGLSLKTVKNNASLLFDELGIDGADREISARTLAAVIYHTRRIQQVERRELCDVMG